MKAILSKIGEPLVRHLSLIGKRSGFVTDILDLSCLKPLLPEPQRRVYPCAMKSKLSKDSMGFFRELGILVETRWREKNYDDVVFPEIAAAALAERSPAVRVDAWDIIRALTAVHALPSQQDIEGTFGDPPLTLFVANRFYIDIYFWLDGTTHKHQHAFAGAFQVLLGSSIHSHYRFAVEKRINPHFSIGRLSLNDVELLSAGDIKRIIPGSDYIHSLFHLDRPSATITVRTVGLPDFQPQFSYLPPGIAYDPFFKEPAQIKKRQIANLLLEMQHREAEAIIARMLSSSDLHTDFMILDQAYQNLHRSSLQKSLGVTHNVERFDKLFAAARRKHGHLVDCFPHAFAEGDRVSELVRRRNYVHSAAHRFFFALLLNVNGRQRILDLVRRRFPEQSAVKTVVDWIEELASTRAYGSEEPNALGIENFGDEHLLVLEGLLNNQTLPRIQKEMRNVYKAMKLQEANNQTRAIHDSLLKAPVFKPLLAYK